MKKNGFTLIELLAVIVILAIIALIATPIVLDIINDTKTNANLRSGEFYVDAVEQAITKHMMNDATFKAKECMIKKDGNLLCSELGFNICEERNAETVCSGKETEVKIEVSGEKPTEGIIELDKGKVEDVKLVLSNNSLVMKENSLVFETDTEVIYEADIVAGEELNIPDDFDYNIIYNVSFTNPDLGVDEKQRGILVEMNGNKYLTFEGYLGTVLSLPLSIPSSPYEGHLKIEKTDERLEDYSVVISSKYITVFSNYFVASPIKISILDENGTEIYNGNETLDESVVEGYAMGFHFMGETVGNTCYNSLKENKKLYIIIEQETAGKKVIRKFGSIPPKYQETNSYAHANDSYYWGSKILPPHAE